MPDPDPFESARRKLARAKSHLADLKQRAGAFHKSYRYEEFTEPDPKKPENIVHKIRMIGELPPEFSEMTGDIVDNLRSALDHAMHGVAIASGCQNPRNAYFPFSREAAKFEAALKGRSKDVPEQIYPLLRSYEPYKGGSEALWALNQVCNANKHKLLIPVGAVTFSTGIKFEGTGFCSMPYVPVWDSTKNEMELFTVGPGSQFKGHFTFGIYIAFGEIESVVGKNAIPTLDLFVDMVETIINEIDAESRRLGIVT
jgi:hypothetical protein